MGMIDKNRQSFTSVYFDYLVKQEEEKYSDVNMPNNIDENLLPIKFNNSTQS